MNSRVFVTERDLASTFDGGSYADAYEIVTQYRQAMRYASKHDVKSGATASALDLPRGRLRTWIDEGGAPDAIRAIETARSYGWLNITYDDAQFAALNALVANVFSGGSIADHHYRPSFALNHRGRDSHVIDALELADIDYQIVDDRHRRADEARPTTDGTVLGRVLVTMGAPIGPKAQQRLELPAYLEGAPESVRELFVFCYLENRATTFDEKDTLRVAEDRNQSYHESLVALIESVAGETVSVDNRGITISAAAARALGDVK